MAIPKKGNNIHSNFGRFSINRSPSKSSGQKTDTTIAKGTIIKIKPKSADIPAPKIMNKLGSKPSFPTKRPLKISIKLL